MWAVRMVGDGEVLWVAQLWVGLQLRRQPVQEDVWSRGDWASVQRDRTWIIMGSGVYQFSRAMNSFAISQFSFRFRMNWSYLEVQYQIECVCFNMLQGFPPRYSWPRARWCGRRRHCPGPWRWCSWGPWSTQSATERRLCCPDSSTPRGEGRGVGVILVGSRHFRIKLEVCNNLGRNRVLVQYSHSCV